MMTSSKLFRGILICLFFCVVSCVQKQEPEQKPVYIDVSPYNIKGEWQLVQLDGKDLLSGMSMRITFNTDETYEMWSNEDTSKEKHTTGDYQVYTDPELGAVIRGDYDYINEYWNRSYVVKLTADTMLWTSLVTSAYPTSETMYFKRIK